MNTDDLFFTANGLDRHRVQGLVDEAMAGADDGELFLEYAQSERLVFDDGRLRTASFDVDQGFGLRAVAGEATGYAHSAELSEAAIKRAAGSIAAVKSGHSGVVSEAPAGTNAALYPDINPLEEIPFEDKIAVLKAIDSYLRERDSRVRQVTCSIAGEWQAVEIVRAGGHLVRDIRPLVRLDVSVVTGEGDRQETGSAGAGGRQSYATYLAADHWRDLADDALRQALINLESVPCPAGTYDVVVDSGWPGVLLHEAVGHGLEGDFNRKKTSAFAGLMGERVAAPGVTVVDDGTLEGRRGSLTVDDEGTPTSRTVLIEDGILKGLMQDRLNARLMGVTPTGNGRRESHAHMPLPRMTNTFMLAGDHPKDEIIGAVKDGIYAVSFGGGQVDITSGKFVFACTEAYRIENGRLGTPLKGATLIGNGPDALTRVQMIGDKSELDRGVGVCGKQGQGVPVGVGQPAMLIGGLTVGGTAA